MAEADAQVVRRLDVAPGSQALVRTGGAGLPFGRLPAAAFENLLVVSTGRTPERVERALVDAGCDRLERVGVIPVTGSDVSYDGPLWVTDRVSPSDLTGISIRFSNALRHVRPGRGWVVFDNVSTLYMYASDDRVYHLLSRIGELTTQRDARGVFVVVRGMLDDETNARLRAIVDGEHDLST